MLYEFPLPAQVLLQVYSVSMKSTNTLTYSNSKSWFKIISSDFCSTAFFSEFHFFEDFGCYGIPVIELLEGEELTGSIDGIWEGKVVEGLFEGNMEGPWDGEDVIGSSEGIALGSWDGWGSLGEIKGIEVGNDESRCAVMFVKGLFEGIIDIGSNEGDSVGEVTKGIRDGELIEGVPQYKKNNVEENSNINHHES